RISPEHLEVGQIFVATGRAFVRLEVVQRDEIETQAINGNRKPACVAGGKFHTVDAGEQINSAGRVTQLDDAVWLSEILGTESQGAKSELAKRLEQALRVAGISANPEVQVTGVTRITIGGQCISADDQVLNRV
ncbi:MAG: hypothetical protein ABIN37_03055, partial [Burkholderiaceae bacterium]